MPIFSASGSYSAAVGSSPSAPIAREIRFLLMLSERDRRCPELDRSIGKRLDLRIIAELPVGVVGVELSGLY